MTITITHMSQPMMARSRARRDPRAARAARRASARLAAEDEAEAEASAARLAAEPDTEPEDEQDIRATFIPNLPYSPMPPNISRYSFLRPPAQKPLIFQLNFRRALARGVAHRAGGRRGRRPGTSTRRAMRSTRSTRAYSSRQAEKRGGGGRWAAGRRAVKRRERAPGGRAHVFY